MYRPLVSIESPFKGDVERNIAFARNACLFAIKKGRNPFAMHLFFTQFLNDSDPEERKLGIECGLSWTDNADEVWFCLRENEEMSDGMKLALKRNRDLFPHRKAFLIRLTQDGMLISEQELMG